MATGSNLCLSCGLPPSSGRKYCQVCGAETDINAVVCVQCGNRLAGTPSAPPGSYPPGTREGASTMSIVAFALALGGFASCITAIPGLILGCVELKRIKRGESAEAGRGFALAAAIVGGLLTAGVVLMTIFYIFAFSMAIISS